MVTKAENYIIVIVNKTESERNKGGNTNKIREVYIQISASIDLNINPYKGG